jgi:integrase
MGTITALEVKRLGPGRHHDGDGLILVVKPTGARSWIARLMAGGRRREVGLGGFPEVGLAEARARLMDVRRNLRQGVDPVAEKRATRAAADARREPAAAGPVTFAEAARACHERHRFSSDKLRDRWIGRLERYAFPRFGSEPVEAVTGAMVVDALDPIWLTTPHTALRVRQLVQRVLSFAHVRGWRATPPPNLVDFTKDGLDRQPAGVRHRPAVPFEDAPAVVARLRAEDETVARLALELLILTAARTAEVRFAVWGEIDFDRALWTIPAARMKMRIAHDVPLSSAALAVLNRATQLRTTSSGDELVFPGLHGRPMSENTVCLAHKRIARGTVPHGWRACFRTWVGEATDFEADAAERALAHKVGDNTRAAYERGRMVEKRRPIMEAWANYLMTD